MECKIPRRVDRPDNIRKYPLKRIFVHKLDPMHLSVYSVNRPKYNFKRYTKGDLPCISTTILTTANRQMETTKSNRDDCAWLHRITIPEPTCHCPVLDEYSRACILSVSSRFTNELCPSIAVQESHMTSLCRYPPGKSFYIWAMCNLYNRTEPLLFDYWVVSMAKHCRSVFQLSSHPSP